MSSIVDLLEERAAAEADRPVFTWLDEWEPCRLTYGDLARQARHVAALLRGAMPPGARVLLALPPGLSYVTGLFGCLWAGTVPVPAYPPRGRRGIDRLKAVVSDCGASCALVASLEGEAGQTLGLPVISVGVEGAVAPWTLPDVAPDSLALLQYTSGSTGTPRGVMLSHANVLAGCAAIHERFGHTRETRGLLWLPPYHDMGLIGGIFQPIYSDFEIILMSPAAFARRPLAWLEAISRFRATVSGAPDFAYELCIRRSTPDEREALDLSSWQVAFTGAEPVRAGTVARFASAFSPSGLRSTAMYPCYGLAEATLLAAGGAVGQPVEIARIDAEALRRRTIAEADEGAVPQMIVACGTVAPAHEALIVSPETALPCSPHEVGEIWLSGPGIASGYWNRPELSEATFGARLADGRGPYLRTGDLGFLREGRLFVAGRLKDVIILSGRNHHPHDIEACAEACLASARPGGAAAFAVERDGQEEIVVLIEVPRPTRAEVPRLITEVRSALARAHGIAPLAVGLLAPGSLLRTSSGKIRRGACRRAFEDGALRPLALDARPAPGAPRPEVPARGASSGLLRDLTALTAQIAGIDDAAVDPDAALVTLGLDSLGAFAFQAACLRRWHARLGLSEILDAATTLRALAIRLAAAPPVPPQVLPDGTDGFAMTMGQRALWILDRGGRGSGTGLARAFVVRGRLEPAALRRALERLIARHEVLRACFPSHNGVPFAAVRADGEDWFRDVDVRRRDEVSFARLLGRDAEEPLDLAAGPPFHVVLYRRAEATWVLLLRAHHVVVDFGSLAVLWEDLDVLFARERGDGRARLSPPSLPFAVHAAEEAARMAHGEAARRAEHHWRAVLGDRPPRLCLPTLPRHAACEARRGQRIGLTIPVESVDALRAFARRQGVTPYIVLTCAWAVLLHRLGGAAAEGVVVGCPVSCRDPERFARTVGNFVNMLPLVVTLADDPPLAVLVARAQRQWADSLECRDVPFPAIIERLRLDRSGDLRTPFQTLVTLHQAGRGPAPVGAWALGLSDEPCTLAGLALEPVALPPDGTQVDLALSLLDAEGGVVGAVEFDPDLLDAAAVRAMADQFVALVAQAVRTPERPLSRLPLHDEAERRRILSDWSPGLVRPVPHATLVAWWRHVVRTHGERTALTWPGGTMRYRDLAVAADAVAAQLKAAGIAREEPVAIHAERVPETVAGLLGILAAGGAYLPLDPALPAARAGQIAAQAGIRLILARAGADPGLPEAACLTVDLAAAPCVGWADAPLAGRSAAYVIFTSGSTGIPKGVVAEHSAVCNLVAAQIEAFRIGPGSVVLQYASFGFDASVSEVFATLLAGGTLHLPAADGPLVGEALARILAERVVTVATLPPSVVRTVDPAAFARVETLVVAGESCPPGLAVRPAGGCRFINAYGPTEASVCATLACWAEDEEEAPIGRPLANLRVYVLNRAGEPAALGEVGEVFIGGAGVARGYLGDPALTAERFRPDPFGPDLGARLYRTGDLARWRTDGTLHFVGRRDGQVKIRGVRIEPGDVEASILAHPDIRECAVVARLTASGEMRLVCCFTAPPPAPPPQALRAFLRERLPAAMIPDAFLHLGSLPRGLGGKIDRAALPGPVERPPQRPSASAASLEQLIAGIWRDVIPAETVEPHENFFDAGGTSLSAAEVHARLQSSLGRRFPLLDLFIFPSVSALAAHLSHPRQERLAAPAHPDPAAALRRGAARLADLRQPRRTDDR